MIGYLKKFRQYREAEKRSAATANKNRKHIESLTRNPLPIKLELGAGQNRGLPGWTYIDNNDQCDLKLDLTKPLPFPENSVDIIYSSHLLEHFNYKELLGFLKESRRILKPDGIFSAALPNARIYIDAYYCPDEFNVDDYCRYKPALNFNSEIDYINYIAYMDGHHKYMFDDENIQVILKNTGFRKVRLRSFDEALDLAARDIQSIYVEAYK